VGSLAGFLRATSCLLRATSCNTKSFHEETRRFFTKGHEV